MPELPDLSVYIETIGAKTIGDPLEHIRLASPFLVRTVDPPVRALEGKRVLGLRRVGKRIVLALEGELFLVVHLMISGRFRWRERGIPIPKKLGLAAFDFPRGTLLLTEASSKKRASLHVVRGEAALRALDPGGVEPLEVTPAQFAEALRRESHTLKRSLTDPRFFAGIGNAYSDEILHRARLSPTRLTRQLDDAEVTRLFDATGAVLREWTLRLREESGGEVPEKVTAFHAEMAVHGRYGAPCPVCGAKVQRIVHAENESNYCARCQTGGKLLADRALSRLLREDWPRSLDELEAKIEARKEVREGASPTSGRTPSA
jgi:formamidopyrimidine-DNA glycosylase